MSDLRSKLGDRRGDASDDPKQGPSRRFSRTRAIRLLAEGVSQTKVAELLGVTQPAISVFQKRDDVKAAIAELRSGAREAGKARLTGMVNGALDVIWEILDDKGCEPRDRLKAAAEILARVYDTDGEGAGVEKPLTAEDLELARRFLAERDAETKGQEVTS